MANKNLDTTITLKTTASINGIFELDTTVPKTIIFDDEGVTGATLTATTGTSGVKVVDAGISKVSYVYVKNTDNTNYVILQNDAAQIFGRLLPGEWAFYPVAPNVGLEVRAHTADVIIDVAVFSAP